MKLLTQSEVELARELGIDSVILDAAGWAAEARSALEIAQKAIQQLWWAHPSARQASKVIAKTLEVIEPGGVTEEPEHWPDAPSTPPQS